MVKSDCGLDRIVKEKFTHIFRKGYVKVNGTVLSERFKDFQESIENLEVFDDDVWICSFPKSGTTWCQEMVWMIANNLDFEGGKENLGVRFPFLELSTIFDFRDIIKANKEFHPPNFLEDSLNFIKNLQRPRFIKTHLPFNLLPRAIRDGTSHPKIIYVARNPKDTCISYFHHCKLLEGFTGNFEEFSRLFLADKLSYTPYWGNVLPFWQRRNNSNILYIKYEDMKKDLGSILNEVSTFLGTNNLNEQQLETLKQHLSFNSMKLNRSVNYETLLEMIHEFKIVEQEGKFMREGKIGGHKSLMGPKIIEQFDEWVEENSKGSGLGF